MESLAWLAALPQGPLNFDAHCPVAFYGSAFSQTTGTIQMEEKRSMINPGSVGQPRDGDSRTSFLIWDAGKGAAAFYRIRHLYLAALGSTMRSQRWDRWLLYAV